MAQSLFDYLGDRPIADLIDAYKENPEAIESLYDESILQELDYAAQKRSESDGEISAQEYLSTLAQYQAELVSRFLAGRLDRYVPPIEAFCGRDNYDIAVEFWREYPETLEASLQVMNWMLMAKASSKQVRQSHLFVLWRIDQWKKEGKPDYFIALKLQEMMWEKWSQFVDVCQDGLYPEWQNYLEARQEYLDSLGLPSLDERDKPKDTSEEQKAETGQVVEVNFSRKKAP